MSDNARPETLAFRELEQLVRHQLEHENAVLRGRLDSATARTKQMLDRVRFSRQQAQGAER